MKKMHLVLLAAVMAIGFSAFTTDKAPVNPPYLYLNGAVWTQVPSGINVPSACPTGTVKQCKIEINGEDELIYHSDHSAYMRN